MKIIRFISTYIIAFQFFTGSAQEINPQNNDGNKVSQQHLQDY
jgi:hypothetical protein